jgi:uncharacterized DUF497 family protein
MSGFKEGLIETIRNPIRGFRYLPRLIAKKALQLFFLRSKNNPFLLKLLSLERRFMKRRIRIDITEGAKRHIASHNVRVEEVITIFEQDYFVKREGRRYELIGRTREGRFLALFLDREKDKFKLITARDATKAEKELYKKKAK